jgi:hypothetical protein
MKKILNLKKFAFDNIGAELVQLRTSINSTKQAKNLKKTGKWNN